MFDSGKPFICTNPFCQRQFTRPAWWTSHARASTIGCAQFELKSIEAYREQLLYEAKRHTSQTIPVANSPPLLPAYTRDLTDPRTFAAPTDPNSNETATQHSVTQSTTLDTEDTAHIPQSSIQLHPTATMSPPSQHSPTPVNLPQPLILTLNTNPNPCPNTLPLETRSDALSPSSEDSSPHIASSLSESTPAAISPDGDNYEQTYRRTEVPGGFKYSHPTAGRAYGKGNTRWEKAAMLNEAERRGNRWGIFGSERQWQIAYWMATLKNSQQSLDDLLKTHIMNGLSFRSSKKLFHIVEKKLAGYGGPVWNEVDVVLDDAPEDTHTFWYRDLQAVLDDLFGHPTLSKHMAYCPEVIHDTDDKTRRYGNMNTGKLWNRLQAQVPTGTTIGGAMIASDKTQLSAHGGNVSAHAVYVSLANIDKSLRSHISLNTWVLVAYIPVSKFPATMVKHENESKHARTQMKGLLNRRLLHRCLSILTRPLRRTEPHLVTDPSGTLRSVVYKLMAYIGDLEEQTHLAGIGTRCCPHCLASALNLGESDKKTARTSKSIIEDIRTVHERLATKYPNERYTALDFLKEGKELGLNGVDKPFWELIPDCDICEVLSPDLLHGFHKFFYDHVFDWNTTTLGPEELDARMRSQIRLTGDRSFPSGVSHLSQTTMKEHRDLQRVHVSVVAGAPVPEDAPASHGNKVTLATRSILDCLYLGQYNSHSDRTLKAYSHAYAEFHRLKEIWLENGGRSGKDGSRNHFNIPKLHVLRHLADHVELKGTADNYTTESMEHLHIDLVKNAYRASNRRNWKVQTTRWLTRREKINDFAAWMSWCQKNREVDGVDYEFEDPEVVRRDWADEEDDDIPEVVDEEGEDPGVIEELDGDEATGPERDSWLEMLWGQALSMDRLLQECDKTAAAQHSQHSAVAAEPRDGVESSRKRKRAAEEGSNDEARPRSRPRTQPQTPQGLSPLQRIRLKPCFKRMPIQESVEQFATPDLLTGLQNTTYCRSLRALPDDSTTIDIWPYIRVQPPPRLNAPPTALQRVRVQPGRSQESDSVLYLHDPAGPSTPSSATRIQDCSVGQIVLLFRITPSVFDRNPPLFAYVHRFTKIPPQPNPTTGMYIIRKDRRTNGQLFGRVIEASHICRLCPLAPVIEGSANRAVTPGTSFAFYQSFYINKYHSHELFEYLHEI